MANPPRPSFSWLTAIVLVLLGGLMVLMLHTFWLEIDPPEPAVAEESEESEENVNADIPEFALADALRILNDAESPTRDRAAAVTSVERAGRQAAPDLVRMLESPSPVVRKQACHLLGRLGPAAPEAIPRLTDLCEEDDPEVRSAALAAVWAVDSDHERLRELLWRVARRGPRIVSQQALDCLATLHPSPIEEFFEIALENKGLPPRERLNVLAHLQSFATGDLGLVRRMLHSGLPANSESLRLDLETLVRTEQDDKVHQMAVLSLLAIPLTDIDTQRKYAPEILAAMHRHRDAPGGEEIVNCLQYVDDPGLKICRGLLDSRQPSVRYRAAHRLTLIQNEAAADLLPLLREALKTETPDTVYGVWGVDNLGEAGKAALPDLLALRHSSNRSIAGQVRQVLRKWGVEGRPAPRN